MTGFQQPTSQKNTPIQGVLFFLALLRDYSHTSCVLATRAALRAFKIGCPADFVEPAFIMWSGFQQPTSQKNKNPHTGGFVFSGSPAGLLAHFVCARHKGRTSCVQNRLSCRFCRTRIHYVVGVSTAHIPKKQKPPYRGFCFFWRVRRDSNPRPPGSKPDTLSN